MYLKIFDNLNNLNKNIFFEIILPKKLVTLCAWKEPLL